MLGFLDGVTPGFLKGYRTHIVTALGVLGAVAGWAIGELTTAEAIGAVLVALGFDSVRLGMSDKRKP